MADNLRKSGIGIVGDIPWGTHISHFFETKEDLLDILLPYFKTGLEENEFCLWCVFEPLDQQEARKALDLAMPGVSARLAAGDLMIVPQSQWDLIDGVLDWEARGYAGMRVSVGAALCEEEADGLIANNRMILLSACPVTVNRAAEIFNADYTHRLALARREGNWQFVEPPELRQARVNAEEALREFGERSRCYFELGPAGRALGSPGKGCIEVNHRLCEMLGYEQDELMQMTWAELVHPDDLPGDITAYGKILSGEVDAYRIAKRWICKNGDIVHTNMSVNCQRHRDGSVNYFAAMIEEVAGEAGPEPRSDQKELSRRERDVTRLIGMGKTVKETAAILTLSEKTVSTYRSRILIKLKLTSTAELIRYALKSRLAE